MTSRRVFARASLLALSAFLMLASGIWGQEPENPTQPNKLIFSALPAEQLFTRGEDVVLTLELYNWSEEQIFVSSLNGTEVVNFSVTGPDGEPVPWQGDARSTNEYSPADFAVLDKYHLVRSQRVISLKAGRGFVFDKPGQYVVTAEYSQEPAESFGSKVKVPTGVFRSSKAAFCIEVCVSGPEPPEVHSNVPPAALRAVRSFYGNITRYRHLGIPGGRTKEALRPLLSGRLVQELDSLQACDDDYYQRYGEVLKTNQYKPATPWLEEGLFTGPDDAATPLNFSILSSRRIGDGRVDVYLRFGVTCCGQPAWYPKGVVTVIRENNHWVVDDYVAMYGNDELHRLSEGYPQCRGGRWIGETPE